MSNFNLIRHLVRVRLLSGEHVCFVLLTKAKLPWQSNHRSRFCRRKENNLIEMKEIKILTKPRQLLWWFLTSQLKRRCKALTHKQLLLSDKVLFSMRVLSNQEQGLSGTLWVQFQIPTYWHPMSQLAFMHVKFTLYNQKTLPCTLKQSQVLLSKTSQMKKIGNKR